MNGASEAPLWATISVWMWLEDDGSGGPLRSVVQLVPARRATRLEIDVPGDPTTLLNWWDLINRDAPSAAYIGVWWWQEGPALAPYVWVSLDPVPRRKMRDVVMPTSARGRAAIHKAIGHALMIAADRTDPATAARALEAQLRAARAPVAEPPRPRRKPPADPAPMPRAQRRRTARQGRPADEDEVRRAMSRLAASRSTKKRPSRPQKSVALKKELIVNPWPVTIVSGGLPGLGKRR